MLVPFSFRSTALPHACQTRLACTEVVGACFRQEPPGRYVTQARFGMASFQQTNTTFHVRFRSAHRKGLNERANADSDSLGVEGLREGAAGIGERMPLADQIREGISRVLVDQKANGG